MKTVLVAGGAGYIGSHANKMLHSRGYDTVVYDNLIYGHRDAVKWGDFVLGDLCDIDQLRILFQHNKIDAVMHFSAYAYVGESVTDPEKYYFNNVSNTLNLLKVMREYGCDKFIFSSTCATYGCPEEMPITENHIQNPINPYGRSKLMIESILKDYSAAYGLKYVIFRYFNAAGADPDAEIGERHNPETHLIPLILDAASGRREDIKIFGTDYDTPDGTCIRDYIHVNDLAEAHILGLKNICDGGESDIFNLGNGTGYSVKDVISCTEAVTGKKIKSVACPRREGDPAVLVGCSDKIRNKLGWKPELYSLESIIETAWRWYRRDNSI